MVNSLYEAHGSLANAVEALVDTGWTVDMVVDYGSHARGEARPD